jgi:hypothetical protein
MTEEYTLGDLCEDCLTLPGHDNAIIGMVSQTISKHVLYHIPTIIQNLVNEGMNMEDALEHFDYNIRGSSQGDSYPMFLDVELNPKSKNGEYVFEVREWGVI